MINRALEVAAENARIAERAIAQRDGLRNALEAAHKALSHYQWYAEDAHGLRKQIEMNLVYVVRPRDGHCLLDVPQGTPCAMAGYCLKTDSSRVENEVVAAMQRSIEK